MELDSPVSMTPRYQWLPGINDSSVSLIPRSQFGFLFLMWNIFFAFYCESRFWYRHILHFYVVNHTLQSIFLLLLQCLSWHILDVLLLGLYSTAIRWRRVVLNKDNIWGAVECCGIGETAAFPLHLTVERVDHGAAVDRYTNVQFSQNILFLGNLKGAHQHIFVNPFLSISNLPAHTDFTNFGAIFMLSYIWDKNKNKLCN